MYVTSAERVPERPIDWPRKGDKLARVLLALTHPRTVKEAAILLRWDYYRAEGMIRYARRTGKVRAVGHRNRGRRIVGVYQRVSPQ